jgi:hypothetical protein
VTQHASLSAGRWGSFTLDQQILMIGNEMNRALRLLDGQSQESLRRGYERVLRLVDLTIETNARRGLRRELLRWRDLIAEQFIAEIPDREAHLSAFRALLQMTPAAARQIPLLLA